MRWRILALLCAARVGLGIQFQTVASVGDALVGAFGFSYADLGLLIGLFMLPGLFLALPAGYAGRYISDRAMASIGLGALALGGVVSGLAPDGWTIGLGRALSGIGFVLSQLYFTKMAADWFDGREMATAMSILVISWPIGIAIGQVGHVWLADLYSWRVPFMAASVYCVLAALAIAVVYRPASNLRATKASTGSALTVPEWGMILCAGVAWGVYNVGYIVYLAFGPDMLKTHGLTPLAAAAVLSVGSWVMIVSGALCGQIADRFGRRNTILTICIGAAILSLALLSVPGAGLGASVLFGLLGLAPAGILVALAGQAVAPERRALGMGIFFTIYHAFQTAGPPLAGIIYDQTGSPQGPLILGMVMFFLVLPAAFIFRWIKARQPVPA